MDFDSSRILTDNFPRRVYKQQSDTTLDSIVVKGLHFGQRKLLLSEVEYLTNLTIRSNDSQMQSTVGETVSKPYLAVYAGAAMGLHLTYLFELFVDVKFVLIDPAPFCQAVRDIASQADGPILELIEDCCTDEVCLRLSRMYSDKYRLVLISDIRSGDPSSTSNIAESNCIISRDNSLQRGWCYALKAHSALLKFHPPYPACDLTAPSVGNSDTQNAEPTLSTQVNSISSDENNNNNNNTNNAMRDCTGDTRENDAVDEQSSSLVPTSTCSEEESTFYLSGIRLFGVWSPKSSSEVRLVVSVPFTSESTAVPHRHYNIRAHEEQCYFYNTTDRFARDCEAERIIWQQYCLLSTPLGREGVQELSRKASEKLGHALFCPLQPTFAEHHARWLFLLCSTRERRALQYFDRLKNDMTTDKVKEIVTMYKDATDVPTHVTVNSVELSCDFWRIFCKGNFTEAYSFPRVRWSFWRQLWSQAAPGKKSATHPKSARGVRTSSSDPCKEKRSRFAET